MACDDGCNCSNGNCPDFKKIKLNSDLNTHCKNVNSYVIAEEIRRVFEDESFIKELKLDILELL